MELTYKLSEVKKTASKLIENADNQILLFKGELGAGKTTLIKEIVRQLGSEDIVSSPTFSLVNEYKTEDHTIFHFDFYRIEEEEEAMDMGFEEYLASEGWVLIEWPEKIENLLPEEATLIEITVLPDKQRKLKISKF